MTDDSSNEIKVLNEVISLLAAIDPDGRRRILATVATYYDIQPPVSPRVSPPIPEHHTTASVEGATAFSESTDISPKDFLREKQPQTDVERVACIAYYLTHYRDLPNFKTLDISKLNTEAAQPKFSNAAKATANAMQYGYLAPAARGYRQISAAGEDFVAALPDRTLAKEAMARARPKRRSGRKSAPQMNKR